jgi:MFS family permease
LILSEVSAESVISHHEAVTYQWFNKNERSRASSLMLSGVFLGPVVGPAVTVSLVVVFASVAECLVDDSVPWFYIQCFLGGLFGYRRKIQWFSIRMDEPVGQYRRHTNN